MISSDMKTQWLSMPFWNSGEWQAINEKLPPDDKLCPARDLMWRPLEELAPHEVKVVICGQDPYPNPDCAIGIPFGVPYSQTFPPTLNNILKEYEADLKYPFPTEAELLLWLSKGVFLWNVIPTCEVNKSLSHDFPEWELLNKNIFDLIGKATEPYGGVVWVFLGAVARRYTKFVPKDSPILEYSHPSPRGANSGKSPFRGSRIFSTINDKLCGLGRTGIDWRLPETPLYTEGDKNAKISPSVFTNEEQHS